MIDKCVGVIVEIVEKGIVIIGYRLCICLDCILFLFINENSKLLNFMLLEK